MVNPTSMIVNTLPARWLAGGKIASATGVVGGAKGAFSAGMASLGPLGGMAVLIAGSLLLAWKADDMSHAFRDESHHHPEAGLDLSLTGEDIETAAEHVVEPH